MPEGRSDAWGKIQVHLTGTHILLWQQGSYHLNSLDYFSFFLFFFLERRISFSVSLLGAAWKEGTESRVLHLHYYSSLSRLRTYVPNLTIKTLGIFDNVKKLDVNLKVNRVCHYLVVLTSKTDDAPQHKENICFKYNFVPMFDGPDKEALSPFASTHASFIYFITNPFCLHMSF